MYAALKTPRTVHAPVERRDSNSRLAHQQLIAKTKQGTIDIYFEGDSITRRWGATDYPKLLAHWQKQFHGWNAANFGWGGDTTHNILWRLQNGEFDGVSPKVIVLQAGTNNLPWNGPAQGRDGRRCRRRDQGDRRHVPGESSRGDDRADGTLPAPPEQGAGPGHPADQRATGELADGKKVRFVNINDRLTDGNGELLPGVSGDGVHLEEKGYDAWAAALKPIFTELLGPPGQTDHAPPPTGDPNAARREAASPGGHD